MARTSRPFTFIQIVQPLGAPAVFDLLDLPDQALV